VGGNHFLLILEIHMSDDTTKNNIEENANAPAEVSVDGQHVKQHSLKDQIAVDRYLASKKAAQSKGLGVKIFKINPGGSV
tara:strand:+ start:125 stop:364 length:240 start_codon:yes stop_codon:yes gene_type:complete